MLVGPIICGSPVGPLNPGGTHFDDDAGGVGVDAGGSEGGLLFFEGFVLVGELVVTLLNSELKI